MTSAELEAALMDVGVPCARVNNFQEVFEHPQIVARGVVQEIEHPRLGMMKVTRIRCCSTTTGRISRGLRRCLPNIRKKYCASLVMDHRRFRARSIRRHQTRTAVAT